MPQRPLFAPALVELNDGFQISADKQGCSPTQVQPSIDLRYRADPDPQSNADTHLLHPFDLRSHEDPS